MATYITPKELSDMFNKLSAGVRTAGMKRAALAGGEVIRNYARLNVFSTFSSKQTGTLANSISNDVESSTDKSAVVSIGPTVEYGRIQEFGGTILPVKAKMLHWVNDAGEDVFANVVHLPARPYMRPAVDQHVEDVVKAVEAQIAATVEEAFK